MNYVPMAEARIVDNNANNATQKMNKNTKKSNADDEKNILKILCIDKSGSMKEDASTNKEAKGYTRRDFACQGAMLIVKSLPPGSNVCIISFNDDAYIVCEPTLITNDNKQEICDQIMTIRASGGTDILASLKLAKKKMEEEGVNKADVILITDGEDGYLTNGIQLDNKCKDLKMHGKYPFKIDTIGLGPNADTRLLVKIAEMCGGAYALCYSAFEVGTVFGRAAGRLQLTHDDIYCITPATQSSSSSSVNLDQEDHAFHKEAKDEFMLYKDLLADILTDDLLSKNMLDANQEESIKNYIQNVTTWLQDNKAKNKATPSFYYDYIKDLLNDTKEQIYLAISTDKYWRTWGYSYWQTTGMALKKCYSPNSKDICLSHFGTEKANQKYEEISTLYESMPLIQKTGGNNNNNNNNGSSYVNGHYSNGYYGNNNNNYNNNNYNQNIAIPQAQPLTTSYFNDRDAGCFHPKSTFKLPGGIMVGYDEIVNRMKTNQEVWLLGQNGTSVKVEAVIKTPIPADHVGVNFCKVGETVLTPTHPILHENPSNGSQQWVHPWSLVPIYQEKVDYVFNLILAKDHEGNRYPSVLVDGNLCVCLGHGIKDGSVAEDSFWGAERVIDEYKRIYPEEYAKGYIEANKHSCICDNDTDYVIGFQED
jgi:Mg-chelatase subunit ChlD